MEEGKAMLLVSLEFEWSVFKIYDDWNGNLHELEFDWSRNDETGNAVALRLLSHWNVGCQGGKYREFNPPTAYYRQTGIAATGTWNQELTNEAVITHWNRK